MKQYILTCHHTTDGVIRTDAFATQQEAVEEMQSDYDYELLELGDGVVEHREYGLAARIVYNIDTVYEWEITEADIPDAPFTQMARNLFFIFRDDFECSNDACRLALFKAIFGEQMGEHIYNTKWRNDCHYDFISSLDGNNIKKFADFLLDPYKYREKDWQ